MLVTKISNMLYFIVKTLAKKEECVAIIDRIKKELGKMKESLADKFENTVKYEKDLRDIKLERARINVDETDNWLPKFLRVDLNSD
jgi:short-subunit dehydrogenase